MTLFSTAGRRSAAAPAQACVSREVPVPSDRPRRLAEDDRASPPLRHIGQVLGAAGSGQGPAVLPPVLSGLLGNGPEAPSGLFSAPHRALLGLDAAAPSRAGVSIQRVKGVFNNHISAMTAVLDKAERDIAAHEKRLGLQKAIDKKAKIRKKMLKAKRDRTEALGELAAARAMERDYPNAKMIMGHQKGVGFDQVYEMGAKVMVVEAKGPGAKLGVSDRKGAQMSHSWITHTATGMSNKPVSKKVLEAQKKKQLMRLVITATKTGRTPKKIHVMQD